MPLKDRLAAFADEMREKASLLKPGATQNELLSKAGQADTAVQVNEGASSELQPPK